MKKFITVSFLLLIICPFFLSAKTPDPFHLPASIPVPEWVKQVDWSAPNVHAIDKIIYQYKKSASAIRKEGENREKFRDADKPGDRKENEEP